MAKSARSISKKASARKGKPTKRQSGVSGVADIGIPVVLSPPSHAGILARRIQGAFKIGVFRELKAARKRGYVVSIQGADGQLVRGVPYSRGGKFVIDAGTGETSGSGKRIPVRVSEKGQSR